MQVGQERAKAHGHSKTEFNKQVLHVLLVDAALQPVEALQEARQQGKELLVQQLVAPCGGRGGEGRGGMEGSLTTYFNSRDNGQDCVQYLSTYIRNT